jgi:hypothetical protein
MMSTLPVAATDSAAYLQASCLSHPRGRAILPDELSKRVKWMVPVPALVMTNFLPDRDWYVAKNGQLIVHRKAHGERCLQRSWNVTGQDEVKWSKLLP